jgi:hypothetical protein
MPLKPTEILPAKLELMPDDVMKVFNDCIAGNFTNGNARVLQKDVVNRLVALGYDKNEIYSNHWLDVEEIYESVGWKVVYDKPGYNEDYDASFQFSASIDT